MDVKPFCCYEYRAVESQIAFEEADIRYNKTFLVDEFVDPVSVFIHGKILQKVIWYFTLGSVLATATHVTQMILNESWSQATSLAHQIQ